MHKNNNFKLKLIFPCEFEVYNPYVYSLHSCLPYGMGILTAFLRQHNYYVEQEDLSIRFNRNNSIFPLGFNSIDLELDSNRNEIDRFFESGDIEGKLSLSVDKVFASISTGGFNVIGFSIFSIFHFIFALMLSKKIKQFTNTPIVFGGAFINIYGHLYPKTFNFIDYMIVGDDGMVPFLKLIDYLKNKISISEVPNLIYRDNGKLVINPRQHYSIEDIPIPDYDGLPIHLYSGTRKKEDVFQPCQVTRGCFKKCSFCNRSSKAEFKSYDKIINELSQMKEKYKSKMFFFCDEAINLSYKYLEELCNLFTKNKLDIHWGVYARVDNLDKYILKKMRGAGCRLLMFGIESGSDRILAMMNKGFTIEQASKVLAYSSEVGLKNQILLITGYPHETQVDINQTADFIRKNKRYIHYDIKVYIFQLQYGSPIYHNPETYGVTNLRPIRPRFCFAFDESGGLKWEEKQKQQEDSQKQIMKVASENMRFRWKFNIIFSSYTKAVKRFIMKFKIM